MPKATKSKSKRGPFIMSKKCPTCLRELTAELKTFQCELCQDVLCWEHVCIDGSRRFCGECFEFCDEKNLFSIDSDSESE